MKIGIIGGGAAGLMSAWLLEHEHDITLFEAQDRLGGHAQTVLIPHEGQLIPIEAGFEFFSAALFPELIRLLTILNVPMRPYPLSYTFYTNESAVTLPPLLDHKRILKAFKPSCVATLAQFHYFLVAGKRLLTTQNTSISLEEFTQKLPLTRCFKEDFIYPFFAGSWGACVEDMKSFAAADILTWARVNRPAHLTAGTWLEIDGGVDRYIQKLVTSLEKTRICRGSSVTTLTGNPGNYTVTTANSTATQFDHIIIATNGLAARQLLQNVDSHAKRLALERIEYFDSTIALHSDVTFMPLNKDDWSVANIYYANKTSSLTVHKPWRCSSPLFRSWIMHGSALPNSLYSVHYYQHAKVTPAYFEAQRALQAVQGEDNLWLAGMYMHGIDSHNSALASAISIAQKLAPLSQRLTFFNT